VGSSLQISKLTPPPNLKIIGHRGAGKLAPENTLSSFRKAKELRLNWVEFDIQPAAGFEWVVIHDSTLERTTNGVGQVLATSVEKLKSLDAGRWFHPKYTGERIPRLSETLELLAELDLHPNIEIKIPENLPIAKLTPWLESLTLCLNKHWPAQKPLPLISSFNKDVLMAFKSSAPIYPLGYNIEALQPETVDIVLKNNFFSLHCDYSTLAWNDLERLLENPFLILLYTINDSHLAKKYFDRGVAAIFSDLI